MIAWMLVLACASPPSPPPPPPQVGVARLDAPALRAEITAPAERPRIYNYWATWCGPCVEEMPRIGAFGDAHPEVQVVFVSIDDRRQGPAVDRFLREHGLAHHRAILLDDADPTMAMPAVEGDWPDVVPVTSFVRVDGTRASRVIGGVTEADLGAGLQAARTPAR